MDTEIQIQEEPLAPTHMISMSIMVKGTQEWTQIFGQFCELAENLGSKYPHISVTSSQYNADESDLDLDDMKWNTEGSLFKVQEALMESGIPLYRVADIISAMQNRGILFRERS